MALSSFNPLTIFNDLRDHGLPEPQAEAVVRGYEQSRGDLAHMSEMELLRAEMKLMQAELERSIWRAAIVLGSLLLAATGIIIGAIAAFGS